MAYRRDRSARTSWLERRAKRPNRQRLSCSFFTRKPVSSCRSFSDTHPAVASAGTCGPRSRIFVSADAGIAYPPNEQRLATLLDHIDAAVLGAYDLPPRLERELLEYFRDAKRPVAHPWQHWDVAYPTPGLRLAERVSGRFHAKGNWIREVFQPLPEREAALLREYGE